jgi:hypothetical protein
VPEIRLVLRARRCDGDNADGLAGTADGGIIFTQEQPSRVIKIDKND